MTGRQPGLYWRVSWRVISPLLLLSIFLAYLILLAQRPPSYGAWNPHYVGAPDNHRWKPTGRGWRSAGITCCPRLSGGGGWC